MNAGKLIVIDGGDGAGKATQVALLVNRLQATGRVVYTLDFPQYTQNTFGKLIRECLDGKRGDFMSIDPQIASTLYAADRFESKPRLEEWLRDGAIVVLDRYVSSNMMHQGAKIDDPKALKEFLGWLDHMEHGIFGLPRPDLIVYLKVPHTVRAELKQQAITEAKHGADVKTDVAEQNVAHQAAVEARAEDIVATLNTWKQIDCTAEGVMCDRETIHEAVYQLVVKHLE